MFLFISVCIDVGLIRFSNQNIERKKRLFADGNAQDMDRAIKLKEKINKMIITNGLLFFVSHLPEFAMTVLLLAFEKQFANSCSENVSCIEMIDVAQAFNFVAMSLQILVLKHFDKNFRKSLENILDKMKIYRNNVS